MKINTNDFIFCKKVLNKVDESICGLLNLETRLKFTKIKNTNSQNVLLECFMKSTEFWK